MNSAFDILVPVSQKLLTLAEVLPPQALGNTIQIHTQAQGLPDLPRASIAIFGILESPDTVQQREPFEVDEVRVQLYQLMQGNWHISLVDLGNIPVGNTIEDTCFAVKEITAALLINNIIPVIIGTTQDLTYPTYRAFDEIKDMLHLVAIDSHLDFGEAEELVSPNSYMSKIITEKPNNLFNFSNLGYQSYYIAQEERDLIERLSFDAYRLGNITANLALAEPVLRNADLISLDLRAIKASEIGMHKNFSPNGFTGREICAIARYAGLSDSVSLFGIYEAENTPQTFQMIAQILWYFIEGLNFRTKEYPGVESEDFTKFTVPVDGDEFVFYKSHITKRWWVEIPITLPEHTKTDSQTLLPCAESDYLEACSQNIPERWFRACRKRFA